MTPVRQPGPHALRVPSRQATRTLFPGGTVRFCGTGKMEAFACRDIPFAARKFG